jgi:shikimate dehydrogenase
MDTAEAPKARRDAKSMSATAASRSVLVGLIGAGIQGSRMPALHQAEAAAQGLDCVYKLIDLSILGLTPSALPQLLTAARRFEFAGLNVTHPCKQAILPLLDSLSDDAHTIGAVNTVVFEPDGRTIGYNTDVSGFAESFRRELAHVARGRVVQLGAGGAGAAVAHALLGLGVKQLDLVDTDRTRAERLCRQLSRRFGAGRAAVLEAPVLAIDEADGIVNATPIGMAKYPGTPVETRLLRRDLWVADIIYFPIETELLRAARACGCRTMGGGGMAVFQAVGAFRLFTGIEPDAQRMLRHFERL